MTITQLCPDDLLLAARRGSLTTQDEARLDVHLQRCSRCRATLAAGRAFDAVLGAHPGDDAIAMRIAAQVTQRPARRWLAYVATGSLLLLSGSVAVAAVGRETLQRWFSPTPEQSAAPVASAPEVRGAEPRRPNAPTPMAGAPEAASTAPAGATSDVTSPRSAPSTAAPNTAAPNTAIRVSPPPSEPGAGAAELFANANALRTQGQAAEAERRYLTLQARYPSSTEARVSLVSLARLELGSRPAQALRHFDAYLTQKAHTTLTEEALFGRASALGRLGRTDEERRAWRQLVERYPGSVYAERAKSRLATTP